MNKNVLITRVIGYIILALLISYLIFTAKELGL